MNENNQNQRNALTDPVSKYRTELMGIAIILIMLSYSNVVIPVSALSNGYNTVKSIAQGGVDIFLFLSGLGCYYSLKKHGSVLSFYVRRIVRIFPTYLLIVPFRIVVDVLEDGYTPLGAVRRYSLISFFLDGTLVTWFLAGLILLYFLFPLMYIILIKKEKAFLGILLLYTVILCMFPYLQKKGVVITGPTTITERAE